MGTIIKVSINSKEEQEFEILRINAIPYVKPTHFINGYGEIKEYAGYKRDISLPSAHEPDTYLRLVRKRHTSGGVVFEETGEYRTLVIGDWFWNGEYPFAATPASMGNMKQTIISPVAMEDQP